MLTNQRLGTSTFHSFNALKWQACFYTQLPQTSPCVVSRGSGLINIQGGERTHLPNTHSAEKREVDIVESFKKAI